MANLAKIAAQTADFYQDANRLATSPMVKSMWEKVNLSLCLNFTKLFVKVVFVVAVVIVVVFRIPFGCYEELQ